MARSKSAILTRRDLAALLGVHIQTVWKWEQAGMPAIRGRRGKATRYRESLVRAWLAAREDAATRSGVVELSAAKAMQAQEAAELTRQTRLTRAGKLLPAVEVEKAWRFEVQATRTAILATYTTQADRVHRAATLEGLAGVEAVLKEIAYELLRELSDEGRALPGGEDRAA